MKSGKYELPAFLVGIVDQAAYLRWLRAKSVAHLNRDRKRGNKLATGEGYRLAIHNAIVASDGHDAYTGEKLDWHLIGTYDNLESRAGRREYKAKFALLPTVDHVDDGLGEPNFVICAWRTNDAKNDLRYREFVALCRLVVSHATKSGK